MKTYTLLFLLFLAFSNLDICAQSEKQVVIFLKSGYTVKGVLNGIESKDTIRVVTTDGSTYEYLSLEVDSIFKLSALKQQKLHNLSFGFNIGLASSGAYKWAKPDIYDHYSDILTYPSPISCTINYRIMRAMQFQAGVGYERKGFVGVYYYNNTELKDTTSLAYLTLPLKLRFSSGKKISFHGDLGCYLGYLLKSNKDIDNKIDAGILMGLGAEVQLIKHLALTVGAQYSFGLQKLNIKNYDEIYQLNASTTALTALFGLEFWLF